MTWGRRPKRKASSTIASGAEREGSKLKWQEAKQNPPKSWQQWLRPGVLCRAKSWFIWSGRTVDNVEVTYPLSWTPAGNPDVCLNKDELCAYLGELRREKVKAFGPGKDVNIIHHFLGPNGIFVADPEHMEDAIGDPDDE